MTDHQPHAPSGEPVDLEAIRRKHWKEGGPLRYWCHWDDADWPCHVVAVLDECARLRAELAQVWQQRDAYLLELQKARAVVLAAREFDAMLQDWLVEWCDGPERTALRSALAALDHSPAVGEPGLAP